MVKFCLELSHLRPTNKSAESKNSRRLEVRRIVQDQMARVDQRFGVDRLVYLD